MSEESKKAVGSNLGGGSGLNLGSHGNAARASAAQPLQAQSSHQAIGKELQQANPGRNAKKNRKKGKQGSQQ